MHREGLYRCWRKTANPRRLKRPKIAEGVEGEAHFFRLFAAGLDFSSPIVARDTRSRATATFRGYFGE